MDWSWSSRTPRTGWTKRGRNHGAGFENGSTCPLSCPLPRQHFPGPPRGFAKRVGKDVTTGLQRRPDAGFRPAPNLRTLPTAQVGRRSADAGRQRVVERAKRVRLWEGAARNGPTTKRGATCCSAPSTCSAVGNSGKERSITDARSESALVQQEGESRGAVPASDVRSRSLGSIVGVRRDRCGVGILLGGTSVMQGCSVPPLRRTGQT